MSGTEMNSGMPMIEPGEYAKRLVYFKRDRSSSVMMSKAIQKS